MHEMHYLEGMDAILARAAEKKAASGRLAGRGVVAALLAVLLLGAAPASAIDLTIGIGAGRINRLNSTAAENRLKRQIYQDQQQRLRHLDRNTVVRQPPRVTVPPKTSKCMPWSDQGRYAVVCR